MNCIWITIDSFRQDHCHCYHPEGTSDPAGEPLVVQTPHIDRLAAESLRLNRLRMEALPTVCARRGLFTGRRIFPFVEEPPMKGMYIHAPGWRPLPQDDVTVAEHLSEQGYVCGMVADVYHLMKPSQNFHRGFQSFEWVRGQENDMWKSQPLPPGYLAQYLRPGDEPEERRMRVLTQYLRNQMYRQGEEDYQAARVFSKAIDWLEQNHTHDKFFLYVDSFDPHEPNEAPARFKDPSDEAYDGPDLIYGNIWKRDELTAAQHHHLRVNYAAEVTMVDHWVGRLLETVDRLGLRGNTLVVLMSDHGKIMGEWNLYGMPPSCTGLELNRVPGMVRHPAGQHAGQTFDSWVYNTDLTVTMLDLLGVEPKERTDGRSFWSAAGDDSQFRDYAVVGHVEMISAWSEDWLYLVNTKQNAAALYNLADDPLRQTDVAARYPAERDRLKGYLVGVTEGTSCGG